MGLSLPVCAVAQARSSRADDQIPEWQRMAEGLGCGLFACPLPEGSALQVAELLMVMWQAPSWMGAQDIVPEAEVCCLSEVIPRDAAGSSGCPRAIVIVSGVQKWPQPSALEGSLLWTLDCSPP